MDTKTGRCWNHNVCLTCLLLCLTIPCVTHEKPCLHLFCGFVALLQLQNSPLLIYCSYDHSQNIAPCVNPLMQQGARERSRAEAPDALAWLEAVVPARRAHCSGSVFQEWKQEQGFKLPDIPKCSMIYRSSLPGQMHNQLHSQQGRARCYLSPFPAPRQTSEKLHPKALTEKMPAGVIFWLTESLCGLNTCPELWQNHLPLNLDNLCQYYWVIMTIFC